MLYIFYIDALRLLFSFTFLSCFLSVILSLLMQIIDDLRIKIFMVNTM